jgi:hypothetical protein
MTVFGRLKPGVRFNKRRRIFPWWLVKSSNIGRRRFYAA